MSTPSFTPSESPAFWVDLVVLMTENGFGTYGTDIFKGSKPVVYQGDGPFTTIIPTGGLGDMGTHNASRYAVAYEQPSAQIVVRAEDSDVAEGRARDLYFLLNFVDQFVNGTWWMKCSPKQEPFELGLDGKNRPRFAFNIETIKRPSNFTGV